MLFRREVMVLLPLSDLFWLDYFINPVVAGPVSKAPLKIHEFIYHCLCIDLFMAIVCPF